MPMDVRERIAEWGRRSRGDRLARLAATPSELAAALTTTPATTLARRPAPDAWAPVEVVCHLRDLEESFHDRLTAILASDEPRFATTNPNRWADERQYLRHDAHDALRHVAHGGVGDLAGDLDRRRTAAPRRDMRGRRQHEARQPRVAHERVRDLRLQVHGLRVTLPLSVVDFDRNSDQHQESEDDQESHRRRPAARRGVGRWRRGWSLRPGNAECHHGAPP